MSIQVKFWGVRGSYPCPFPDYLSFGGNTSCIEVNIDGHHLIFDAGSGLQELGKHFMQENVKNATLFLSHFHWDHISGFPFFRPIYKDNFNLDIYSTLSACKKTAQDVLKTQMSEPFFPVPIELLPATFNFHTLPNYGKVSLFNDTIQIKTCPLLHPSGSTGYRLNYNDKSIAYIVDYEHSTQAKQEKLISFVKDCDLMIYDAMFTPEEYPNFVGWGHSTWLEASIIAKAANVKKTALFHHSPDYNDTALAQIEQKALLENSTLFMAKEGQSLLF